jgi:uncharacterized protein YjbI with pentapeptide repeats
MMANPEHLRKLTAGIESWNLWRRSHPEARVDLYSVELRNTSFDGADLHGANLGKANLHSASLRDVNFQSANLSGANLGFAHLQRSNLREATLIGAILDKAELEGATLQKANLTAAFCVRANCKWADLSGANLHFANFAHAILREADLRSGILSGVNLAGADLRGAKLYNATIANAIFGDNDLTTANDLEGSSNLGPYTVGIDTIYRSKGEIPESFLRGCGVPDDFITFAKSLVTSPIQFYSCFISYSTKDQDFADRLYADLQNKGVRCWFAPHDVQGGKKLHEQIDEAIRLHDKLLLILSLHSMESEWVKTEISKARKREVRDQRRVLFPIRLAPFETLRDWECFDADTGKDSAREIREYFIPDFSNWKDHDSYQEAFQRLISDLKASDSKPK